MERILTKICYDPSHPASYEGLNNLYNAVKQEGKFKISPQTKIGWKIRIPIVYIRL